MLPSGLIRGSNLNCIGEHSMRDTSDHGLLICIHQSQADNKTIAAREGPIVKNP
jgi:hypothetical protein